MKQCPRCGRYDHNTTTVQPFCESCYQLLHTANTVVVQGKRGHGGNWVFEYTQSIIRSDDGNSIRAVTTIKPYSFDKTDTRM